MKKDARIQEIDNRLSKIKHILEALIPVWSQVDRRVNALKAELDHLNEEKIKLTEGQLTFDGTFDF